MFAQEKAETEAAEAELARARREEIARDRELAAMRLQLARLRDEMVALVGDYRHAPAVGLDGHFYRRAEDERGRGC